MEFRFRPGSLLYAICILFAIRTASFAGEEPTLQTSGAQVQQSFTIHIPRDGSLLASVEAAIKRNGIQEGAVLTGIGSLQACAYHRSQSLGPDNGDEHYKVDGAMELLNLNGVIHAGKPHLHITFSNEKGAFGGHLEECRVLRGVDLVIVKFLPSAR